VSDRELIVWIERLGWPRHETVRCGSPRAREHGELRDYSEEARAEFRHHRMHRLGWSVVSGQPSE
jgi:hypothetical protein